MPKFFIKSDYIGQPVLFTLRQHFPSYRRKVSKKTKKCGIVLKAVTHIMKYNIIIQSFKIACFRQGEHSSD